MDPLIFWSSLSVRMWTQRLLPSWGSAKPLHALPISIRQSASRPQLILPFQSTRSASQISPSQTVRHLVPPPAAGSGPLLTRRPDRALPSVQGTPTWLKTLPIFAVLVAVSTLTIFNYQKASSSTVNSILYALRTNEQARELLGDEIYFANKMPWIHGELNQLHGIINISFWVKGTKAKALTKFVSAREKRDGYFQTSEWSLKTKDGRVVQLLGFEGVNDPMQQNPAR